MGKNGKDFFKDGGKGISEKEINDAYFMAIESMGHVSKNTAFLM